MDLKNFLQAVTAAPGISGYEALAAELIKAELCAYADEVRQDRLGNVVFLKKGTGDNRPRVLLAAHMDEIGLMVTKIEEGGFLRFTSVGGIDPRTIVGQEVVVFGKERLNAVVGAKPPHLTDEEERNKAYSMEDLFIDLALPEERVRRLVAIGDLAMIRRELVQLRGEVLAGKAMDDRAGVAVLAVCLEELARLHHTADVYAVATVQEEVGVRGAATSTYGIVPDLGIAVDVTHGDMPGVPEHETCKLGKGPAITVGPNIHPKIGNELVAVAKDRKIPYQLEVAAGPTGTDARAIQISRGGIPTGLVSVPLRYMHTSVELLDTEDIKMAGRLLAYFIAGLQMKFVEDLSCC
ncbi:MAG: M42 family metallopeptidase [Firmicutes bacterium]|nr:M42 family metallopeptidase [Bacillota bacterium]